MEENLCITNQHDLLSAKYVLGLVRKRRGYSQTTAKRPGQPKQRSEEGEVFANTKRNVSVEKLEESAMPLGLRSAVHVIPFYEADVESGRKPEIILLAEEKKESS